MYFEKIYVFIVLIIIRLLKLFCKIKTTIILVVYFTMAINVKFFMVKNDNLFLDLHGGVP